MEDGDYTPVETFGKGHLSIVKRFRARPGMLFSVSYDPDLDDSLRWSQDNIPNNENIKTSLSLELCGHIQLTFLHHFASRKNKFRDEQRIDV